MSGVFVDGDAALLTLLDGLLDPRGGAWWDGFYGQRARPCPFLVPWPDESLAGWVERGRLRPGRALDIGCGHGRNALYLARQGFEVEGLDFSGEAIGWAQEQARAAALAVRWRCESVFDAELAPASYDLVYDSGCFHHLPPHRRAGYVRRVADALRPGGRFGLACFRPEGGSGLDDAQVYERRTLGGGLGYTEAQLRRVWSPAFEIEELRPMAVPAGGTPRFGADFLWVLLARRAGG